MHTMLSFLMVSEMAGKLTIKSSIRREESRCAFSLHENALCGLRNSCTDSVDEESIVGDVNDLAELTTDFLLTSLPSDTESLSPARTNRENEFPERLMGFGGTAVERSAGRFLFV